MLYSFLSLVTALFALFSPSRGQTCSGCNSTSSTCDISFVDGLIYGCGGLWTSEGIWNGEHLCGEGFSICETYSYASYLGLTYSDCISNETIELNAFYVSYETSDGSLDCDVINGTNDLFGCGNADTPWLYISEENIDCGPFGAQLSTDSYANGDGGWTYGWEVWNSGDGSNEFETTTHVSVTNTKGGVLCCIDDYVFPSSSTEGSDNSVTDIDTTAMETMDSTMSGTNTMESTMSETMETTEQDNNDNGNDSTMVTMDTMSSTDINTNIDMGSTMMELETTDESGGEGPNEDDGNVGNINQLKLSLFVTLFAVVVRVSGLL